MATTPTAPDATLTRMIKPGGFHTCRIKATGALDCWGDNTYGQLGRGNTTPSSVPVNIDTSYLYTSIAGIHNTTCGTRVDGTVYCWGYDLDGALGNDAATTDVNAPTAIAMTSPVRLLSGGSRQFFGITGTGAAYAWGRDTNNQLGTDLSYTSNGNTPRLVGMRLTGLTATASNSAPGAPPGNALDGDHIVTAWNANAGAVSWIQIDLNKTARVRKVRITPCMTPAGTTTENFHYSPTGTGWYSMGTSTAARTDKVGWDYVVDPPQTDVRFLRISTMSSPSWVCMHEVEVYE